MKRRRPPSLSLLLLSLREERGRGGGPLNIDTTHGQRASLLLSLLLSPSSYHTLPSSPLRWASGKEGEGEDAPRGQAAGSRLLGREKLPFVRPPLHHDGTYRKEGVDLKFDSVELKRKTSRQARESQRKRGRTADNDRQEEEEALLLPPLFILRKSNNASLLPASSSSSSSFCLLLLVFLPSASDLIHCLSLSFPPSPIYFR